MLSCCCCCYDSALFYCSFYLVARDRFVNFFSVVFSGEAVRLRDGGESVPLTKGLWPSVGFWSYLLALAI